MNNRKHDERCPLIVIHNITRLTTNEIERYCRKYDKNLRCFRRKNQYNHQYMLVLFSSMITANQFLNDRPHFIQNCRINTSLVCESFYGPKFLCVQINKYASITEDCLYEYTTKHFGRVLNCVFYSSRGYAFIEFDQLDDAQRALSSSNNEINGCKFQYYPRHNNSNKILPLLPLTKLVHIGNFLSKDQDKFLNYFPNLQNFTTHESCYGEIYILGLFNINDSIELLLKRPFFLNGRILNIFIDIDDKLTECNNYLLVRNVTYRLTDYNLFEYFSKFGYILNCYRYGQTNAYRIQYRDRISLHKVLQFNRIHVIKSVQLQIEQE
ncbi:unnamed protein product [Adineta steineri]|uniref:RRM domain-containing protein n=1 Tax=Adineta steineri TaxID=433720 RepID=A0A813M7W0_9BILA|nr:unnamed protein product [Adineta steineri]CAF3793637.1 unnamed protein product [Adineta steineri]